MIFDSDGRPSKITPRRQFKLEKLFAEEVAAMLSEMAEDHRRIARSEGQMSQDSARRAAEENDPDRKQRLLELLGKVGLVRSVERKKRRGCNATGSGTENKTPTASQRRSPSNEKEAEEATQEALALKQDATAVSASLSNEKEAEEIDTRGPSTQARRHRGFGLTL